MEIKLNNNDSKEDSKNQKINDHFEHDIKTPLNSIMGFSKVLLKENFGPLNERQRRYVSNILEAGQKLQEIVDDKVKQL